MKTLVAVLLCLSFVTASAQEPFLSNEMPTTVTQYDKATGEVAGTTTLIGNRAYLRDRHGEHFATMIIDTDGTKRIVDVNGNPIDASAIKHHLEETK